MVLDDLSGEVSQLSLPCMMRLEWRHDVFHPLGDARDRRDEGRVSFFTNSPNIARRVEGSKSRENLDSENLRESSATSWRRRPGQPRRLHQILKRRSRRSEGGQIAQELNSIRERKCWDDVEGGWFDPVLIRWKETRKKPVKTGWAGTNKETSECPNIRSRCGREGIQHWTEARLIQRNITSGGNAARHHGGNVKQPEGDSALGE